MTDEETTNNIYIVHIKYHELHSTYVSEAQVLVCEKDPEDAMTEAEYLFIEQRKQFITQHKMLQIRAKEVKLPILIRM